MTARPETLRLYASILEKPRPGEVNPLYAATHGQVIPPGEISLAAAAALRFQADAIEENEKHFGELNATLNPR